MKRNKAFTLIELVSVLVILAILALIVTPLVLNILRKARTAADKRSIDAYGRSIELAVADYLLENGSFPTSIDELTIEYSGDRVVCSITQLNDDTSIYLANCTVNGRTIDYTYGKKETITYDTYKIGDLVEYKGINFYVIADSGTDESSVTLLKVEPLTTEEINEYGGVGTANNHVNVYTSDSQGTAYDDNGYGSMAYYSGVTCGNGERENCVSDYDQSEIKYVVDAWAAAKFEIDYEYEARLLTLDDITSLGYELRDSGSSVFYAKTEETPEWVQNDNYSYWMMSPYEDSTFRVYMVGKHSNTLTFSFVDYGYGGMVRPVITLSKSIL